MFKLLNKIDPSRFFVFAAIILGGFFYYLRLPMQSPDEFNHFLRAYQVSEGKFLPEKRDNRLGGEMPVCFQEFMNLYLPCTFVPGYKITGKEIAESYLLRFSDKERRFMDFPNTSYYSPVSYLPQALSLFVLRQFDCSVGFLYNVSRLFVFLVWVMFMFFVIRLLPVHKWLFTLLLLLPMSLYMAVSFSADTVTNILTLLLIASILRLAFGKKEITKKDMLLILLIGVLLAFTKIIYINLLILLLLIPSANFGSKKYKYLVVSGIFLVSFLLAVFWSGVIMRYYITYQDYNPGIRVFVTVHKDADYYAQKEYLLNHPLHFFKVVYNSIIVHKQFYLLSYVGHFGTYMDTPMPLWFLYVSLAVIILTAFTERVNLVLSFRVKVVLFLTALCTYSFLVLSQHLTWNKIGNDNIEALQGRYLVPILPLVFMLFNNSWSKLKLNVTPLILIFVLFANIYACYIIYERHFIESSVSRVDFTCDAEQVNRQNLLVTSDSEIFLEGGDKRTTRVYRSGKHSLLLQPDSSSAAIYKFKDLRLGDLVEIYAWQKGNKGEIIVKGHGARCEPFYYINSAIQFKETGGWQKMQMIFSVFADCDSTEVMFYVHNPTQDTIYFDDLRYSVKKFK